MRIKTDNTAHAPGTIINEDDEMRITAVGQVTVGARSVYQVREMHFKGTGNTETHLIGPRGTMYLLHTYGDTGAFRAISLNSGTPLTSKGNEVLFVRLGNIIEETDRNALEASARERRAADRARRGL